MQKKCGQECWHFRIEIKYYTILHCCKHDELLRIRELSKASTGLPLYYPVQLIFRGWLPGFHCSKPHLLTAYWYCLMISYIYGNSIPLNSMFTCLYQVRTSPELQLRIPTATRAMPSHTTLRMLPLKRATELSPASVSLRGLEAIL